MKKLILMGIIVAIYTLLILTGCPDTGGLLNPTPIPTVAPTPTPTLGPPLILIEGGIYQEIEVDYEYLSANISIYDSNNELPIINATVTVNGTNCVPSSDGNYYANLPATITPGSSITIVITGTGFSCNKTLTMPNATTSITSPTDGSNKDAANPLNVTWHSITSHTPEHIIVYIEGFWTNSGENYNGLEAGNATSHTIPPYTLLPNQANIALEVTSVNSAYPSGAIIDPDSYIDVYYIKTREFNTN